MTTHRSTSKATTANDVMVQRPKWLGVSATIAEVRAQFADDHVHMVLLVDEGRLAGTLTRADLGEAGDPDALALGAAVLEGRTVTPDRLVDQIQACMIATSHRRLAVVEQDGRLLGLLCLKRTLDGFCSDSDVLSRAAARLPPDRLGELGQRLGRRTGATGMNWPRADDCAGRRGGGRYGRR